MAKKKDELETKQEPSPEDIARETDAMFMDMGGNEKSSILREFFTLDSNLELKTTIERPVAMSLYDIVAAWKDNVPDLAYVLGQFGLRLRINSMAKGGNSMALFAQAATAFMVEHPYYALNSQGTEDKKLKEGNRKA